MLFTNATCTATIRERTHSHLRALGGKAVSAKPIVMRAQFAYCPNLTIIDTPVGLTFISPSSTLL